MLRYLDTFDRIITRALLVMMASVALIAVARKIVVLDTKELPEGTLLGIAAMVFALTLGYYLVQRSRREKGDPNPERKG